MKMLRNTTIDKLYKIALSTREHILEFSNNIPANKRWHYPHPNEDLACWCAISSMVLLKNLQLNKVKNADIVVGVFSQDNIIEKVSLGTVNHSWVVVNDKIVDITVTQFTYDLPVITITDDDDDRWAECRRGQLAISSFNKWSAMQSPMKYEKVNEILNYKKFG